MPTPPTLHDSHDDHDHSHGVDDEDDFEEGVDYEWSELPDGCYVTAVLTDVGLVLGAASPTDDGQWELAVKVGTGGGFEFEALLPSLDDAMEHLDAVVLPGILGSES